MKKFFSNCRALRIFSLSVLIIFITFSFLPFQGADPFRTAAAVFAAAANMFIYPLPRRGVSASFVFSLIYALAASAGFLFRLPVSMLVSASCGYVVSYMIFRSIARFRKPRTLFGSNNVMAFVNDFSHLFYLMIFFALSVIFLASESAAMATVLAVVFFVLFVILYIRAYTMRTLFIGATKERQINEISRGEVRNVPPDHFVDDPRMASIYKRIVELMEENKPFLDPSFSIYDLSQIIFTNKTYVSRIINIYSGRNFCQFINYYRIKHAAGLVEADSFLRVTELAMMSGFRSSVTFNAAFRTFMGISPGEYIQKIGGEKLQEANT